MRSLQLIDSLAGDTNLLGEGILIIVRLLGLELENL